MVLTCSLLLTSSSVAPLVDSSHYLSFFVSYHISSNVHSLFDSSLRISYFRSTFLLTSIPGALHPLFPLRLLLLSFSIFQDYFHPALLGSSPPPSSSSSNALSHLVSCERTGNGGIPGRESTKEGTGTSGVGRAGFYEKEEEWREGGGGGGGKGGEEEEEREEGGRGGEGGEKGLFGEGGGGGGGEGRREGGS